MQEETPPPTALRRARRSDAVRNADRLLTAAQELIDERGPEVAFDEVARRAGVGNATLYRHFPTRGDLLAAVYSDEVEELCERGRALLEDPSPMDGLFSWLETFVVHVADRKPLALAAAEQRGDGDGKLFEAWHESIRATALALLDRAHDAGEIDPAVTIKDLLALANGAALAASDSEHARRVIGYARRGIG